MPKRGSCGSVLRCGLPPLESMPTINPPTVRWCTPCARRNARDTSRWLLGMQACPSAHAGVALIIESGATRNSHSARGLAGAQLPATSCLGAFWTPAASVRGTSPHAGVSWDLSRPLFLELAAQPALTPAIAPDSYKCPAKRKRALLGSNPPRNSRAETHCDGGRYVSACRPFPCKSGSPASSLHPRRGRFPHALKIHCSDPAAMVASMIAVRPCCDYARSNPRKGLTASRAHFNVSRPPP